MSKSTEILNIKGEIYKFIQEGYSGGAVDVYKPYGRNIHRYDVNSLYPYIMRNYPMPIGKPTFFEGNKENILNILHIKNKFSFIEVKVTCPDNIKAPLLLTRIGNKTIAPVGTWSGIYTSIEILRALDLGYTFEYGKCVYFDYKVVYKEYVDYYYRMKQRSDKTLVLLQLVN